MDLECFTILNEIMSETFHATEQNEKINWE